MSSVSLKSLHKSFGAVEVLHGIDLEIEDGAFVALVGPSGCGKSTLLRIIAGLEEANDGEVAIGGDIVNDLSPRERNIAMVFQSYALYPHMTVAGNMGFNLKLTGRPKDEIDTRVRAAAEMLGLTELLERKPAQLSGGQRQRVAMGRAVVRNPAVFLFDEPLSNLDAKLRVQMRAEVKLLHQRVGTTAIYVTHDQIEAMTLADQIVVLNKGRIEQIGSPLELYKRPANRFVGGFIGSPSMNFVDAVVEKTDGGLSARLLDGSAQQLSGGLDLQPGASVTIGLRPEHIRSDDQSGTIGGTIRLTEPTGAQTHIVFSLADQDMVAVLDGEFSGTVGDQFSGSIDPAHVHVFDKGTGRAIDLSA